VIFGSFNFLTCQFGTLCLSFWSILFNLDVKYDVRLETYYCDSLTTLPLQHGKSCFINRRTDQFSKLWLCYFVLLCDVNFCQQLFPYWAGSRFWWMAKNLMTNDTSDARAAGRLNFTVSLELPRMRMPRMIPCNKLLRAYIHWSPPSIEDEFHSKVTRIMNEDTFMCGRDHNLEQWGVKRFSMRHGGREAKAGYSDSNVWRK